MSPFTRLEVVDLGRRRRWTEAEIMRIVAESMAGRRQVSATARRHEISRFQLTTWRRLALEGRLIGAVGSGEENPPRFASVATAAEAAAAGQDDRTEPGRIEIMLAGDRRLIVSEAVGAAALARIVAAVEGA